MYVTILIRNTKLCIRVMPEAESSGPFLPLTGIARMANKVEGLRGGGGFPAALG